MRLYSNPHRLLSVPMLLRHVPDFSPIKERHEPGVDTSPMASYTYITITNYWSRISLGFFYPKHIPPKDFILLDVHLSGRRLFEDLEL